MEWKKSTHSTAIDNNSKLQSKIIASLTSMTAMYSESWTWVRFRSKFQCFKLVALDCHSGSLFRTWHHKKTIAEAQRECTESLPLCCYRVGWMNGSLAFDSNDVITHSFRANQKKASSTTCTTQITLLWQSTTSANRCFSDSPNSCFRKWGGRDLS